MSGQQPTGRTLAEVLPSLNKNLDEFDRHDGYYASMACARGVRTDIRDLLALLQPRDGVDDGRPGQIAVTLHGLDVYVERKASRIEVSFGTDGLLDQYPVEVDTDNNTTTVCYIN